MQRTSLRLGIDVRVQNEVIAIHPKNKTVTIRNAEGKEYDESYDKLLLSPHSSLKLASEPKCISRNRK